MELKIDSHTYEHMCECLYQLVMYKVLLTGYCSQRSLTVNAVVYNDNFRYKSCRQNVNNLVISK